MSCWHRTYAVYIVTYLNIRLHYIANGAVRGTLPPFPCLGKLLFSLIGVRVFTHVSGLVHTLIKGTLATSYFKY